ncbi:MAG: acetyl-CoA carboxylase biotin carboxyl carrier protein [Clostridiaceae bacterium]|nr:acetyl-CoA carboxylase biotin carboxyl carrier protein [Clostridiaceae bacterium]
MDYKAIQELIQTINESGLYSLEVESNGTRIKMSKGPEQVLVGSAPAMSKVAVEVLDEPQTVATVEAPKTKANEKIEVVTDDNLHIIKSPIVGTFYASASPEKPHFVSVGTMVKKGSILCILEAMKLMNEIESDVDGEVVEVLVKSEDMVEYGQSLFKIKETGR